MNVIRNRGWCIVVAIVVLAALGCEKDKDENPPTVTLTEPSDGETVSGFVTITVQATDDDSVESITLLIDDSPVDTAYQSSLVYEWNTLVLADSSTHTIQATALDCAGNQGVSATISVVLDHSSERPTRPPRPDGPTSGRAGESLTFTATTTDPNGDSITFQFDWGDGSALTWTDYVASGDTATVQKSFETPGTYKVRVKAKDVHGAYSEYSPELAVEISPAVNTGSIQVNSTPDSAEIWLDGANTTRYTDALLEAVEEGEHTVSLRLDGYADYQATVTVTAGDTTLVAAVMEPVGILVWRYQTADAVNSSPAIGSDGTVYIGSADNKLYAVNPAGGSDWNFPTGLAVNSAPALGADGKIYFGSNDVYVYALHPDGGVKYWDYKTDGYVSSSPAIGADGTVYVGSGDENLWAFESDGDFLWKLKTGGDVGSSPAVASDGVIYVGSDDGSLYAVDPADGSIKWSFKTGGKVSSSPAIGADGVLYVGSQDGCVYALDAADGTERWSCRTGGKVGSSPVVGADGTIYVGSDDNHLYALDPADGTVKWSYETGLWVRSSPAVGANGVIYFGSLDGFIYALRPDGSLYWRYETGAAVSSSPAVADDRTLYIGSTDGYLYAIATDSYGLAKSAWPKFCHDNRNTGRVGGP